MNSPVSHFLSSQLPSPQILQAYVFILVDILVVVCVLMLDAGVIVQELLLSLLMNNFVNQYQQVPGPRILLLSRVLPNLHSVFTEESSHAHIPANVFVCLGIPNFVSVTATQPRVMLKLMKKLSTMLLFNYHKVLADQTVQLLMNLAIPVLKTHLLYLHMDWPSLLDVPLLVEYQLELHSSNVDIIFQQVLSSSWSA